MEIDLSQMTHRQHQKSRTRAFPLLILAIATLTLVVLLQRVRAPVQLSPQEDTSFQKGMSYAAWWSGQYSEPGADLSLELLASTGANWIGLVVTGYQETYTSTTVDFTQESTPTDADLVHVIEYAHGLGLRVMLKPHLDLPNEGEGEYWRGDIGSGFTSEAEWSAWFASYRAFIEHYARLAQTHSVDQFCVGTELLGTTHRDDDWRAVIAGVRAIYDGPIVYAALHGGEEASITWWDAVDYIGVDGYYPLVAESSEEPTVEELEAGWETPKATLANLSATYGKPILLTELGYRSQRRCSCYPWDWWTEGPVDLEEQANAYEAAFRQLYDQPWLGGIFWWTWLPDRFESGPCDNGYSPHLKPAEDVLRAWYGGPPRPPQPIFSADYDRAMDIYVDGFAPGWQDWSWNAVVNTAPADQRKRRAQPLQVELDPWGALSLWHPAFTSGQYHWLEFYVRGSSSSQPDLVVFFDAEDGTRLSPVPVNDCRHMEGGTINAGTWKRVRIPLSDLNAPGLDLTRLSIQNGSSEDRASFWIDDIRLVGATETGTIGEPAPDGQPMADCG